MWSLRWLALVAVVSAGTIIRVFVDDTLTLTVPPCVNSAARGVAGRVGETRGVRLLRGEAGGSVRGNRKRIVGKIRELMDNCKVKQGQMLVNFLNYTEKTGFLHIFPSHLQ